MACMIFERRETIELTCSMRTTPNIAFGFASNRITPTNLKKAASRCGSPSFPHLRRSPTAETAGPEFTFRRRPQSSTRRFKCSSLGGHAFAAPH